MPLKRWVAHNVRRVVGYYELHGQLLDLKKKVQTSDAKLADDTSNLLTSLGRKQIGNKRYISLLEFRPSQQIKVSPPSSYLEKTNGTLEAEECTVTIDENGFIVTGKSDQLFKDKILLLGSSSIENLYIPENERIAAHIEKMFAGTGRKVRVYNGGISFSHILHSINILLNKGIPLRPRCVVYYSSPVIDIAANEVEGSFWNSLSEFTPVKTAGQEVVTGVVSKFVGKNGFRDERALLGTLCDICVNFGIKLYVTTWPVCGEYDEAMKRFQPNEAAFDGEKAQTIVLNNVVRDVCAQKSIELIDLDKLFDASKHNEYFYDWNHPNRKGCELIAAETYKKLAAAF